jgi:hypothetical protein
MLNANVIVDTDGGQQMEWVIPDVPKTRQFYEGFRCDGESRGEHVRGPGDFCKSCGTDLHVIRLRVSRVSYSDAWRLHICEVAERALDDDQATDIAKCDRLGISPSDQRKLADLCLEGFGPALYDACGLGGTDNVGITTDGMFLYAKLGEYEIGSETWLHYDSDAEVKPSA